jgi:hypothetical protein
VFSLHHLDIHRRLRPRIQLHHHHILERAHPSLLGTTPIPHSRAMPYYSSSSSSVGAPASPVSSTSSEDDDGPSESRDVIAGTPYSEDDSNQPGGSSSKKRKLSVSVAGDGPGGGGEDVSIATCQWNDCGEQFGELNSFIQHIHDGQSLLFYLRGKSRRRLRS